MKRSAIGNVEVDTSLYYWSGDKNSEQLRNSEGYLYAEIDLCQENAAYAKSEAEVQAEYNKIDMYFICLQAIEFFANQEYNTDNLEMAGIIIGNMVVDGEFSRHFDQLEERNANLTTLIDTMRNRTLAEEREVNRNNEFFSWYQENVIDMNYYGRPERTTMPPLAGLGGGTVDEYGATHKDGGAYWVYLTTNVKSDDEIVTMKKLKENAFMNWFVATDTGTSRNKMIANARSGIRHHTGLSDTEFLAELQKGDAGKGVNGLGIWALVTAIVGAIIAIIKLVTVIVSKKQDPTPEEIRAQSLDQPTDPTLERYRPDPTDWQHAYVIDPNTGLKVNPYTGEIVEKVSVFVPIVSGAVSFGLTAWFLGLFSDKKKK